MRIVFFGTPEYVVPVVSAIHKKFSDKADGGVVAVVTQPPKIAGRSKMREFSPVDTWAHKHKIQIIFNLDEVPDADLGVVASYGRIIPADVINKFKYGILNIHPSLLPKYRGASPVQAAIAEGDLETGVSIIKMDEEMDHGPIVSSFKEKILGEDTNESLRNRLFERAVPFLIELIPNYINGKINLKEQDHKKATFTKILGKDDGHIKMSAKAPEIERKCRAFTPWPGIWTFVKTNSGEDRGFKRLKILNCHTEGSALIPDQVQLEGKKQVSWEQFKEGYPKYEFEA